MRRLLELTTALGGCERTSILRTPIYTPYLTRTIHLSRFLFLWLVLQYTSRDVPSPRSLVGPVGTIPISAAVTDFMLGIEDIGVQIELSCLMCCCRCGSMWRLSTQAVAKSWRTTAAADVNNPR